MAADGPKIATRATAIARTIAAHTSQGIKASMAVYIPVYLGRAGEIKNEYPVALERLADIAKCQMNEVRMSVGKGPIIRRCVGGPKLTLINAVVDCRNVFLASTLL